jgi:hypothetical protein
VLVLANITASPIVLMNRTGGAATSCARPDNLLARLFSCSGVRCAEFRQLACSDGLPDLFGVVSAASNASQSLDEVGDLGAERDGQECDNDWPARKSTGAPQISSSVVAFL